MDDTFDRIYRNGKSHILRTGQHRCIDADDMPGQVKQWPPAVPWVNGRTALNEPLGLTGGFRRGKESGDHAGRQGGVEAERMSNGEDGLADFQPVGVSEFSHGIVTLRQRYA